MDFAFTEEQRMLREEVRAYLERDYTPGRLAELGASKEGWDPGSWTKMAGLGWTSLSIPEAHGGAGMSFVDEAVLFEELGRALYPGPYFATIGLALPALAGAPDLLSAVAEGSARLTVAVAEPEGPSSLAGAGSVTTEARASGDSWSLSGGKELVCDLGAASHVVVVARAGEGVGLWAVEANGGRVLSTMDSSRRLGSLVLEDRPARLLVAPPDAAAVLDSMRRRALAALALEAAGIATKVLELARDYAGERKQFDKPIGSYQAVSHQVADTYVEAELARSLAYWAAWCVAEADPSADVAAAAAKSLASEAAVAACERSIQVHGGIGFTWEHVLHRYYKRAQWIASFEGTPATQRAAVAAALLDA